MDLLDTGQLAALYDLAGPDTGEMVTDFVRTGHETLRSLETCLRSGALDEAAERAHQLKGGAATMGFAAFGQEAGSWETNLRSGQAPDPAALEPLHELLDASAAAVAHILASDGPPR